MTIDPGIRAEIAELNAAYAACLDGGNYDEWPEFFTEHAWYRIVSRENHDRNMPLSILSLKGVPMMRDRIYGISSTIFHAPYYQTHLVGCPVITATEGGYGAATGYAVYRTKRDGMPDILSVGRYIDEIVKEDNKFKFRKKFCVFDNDIIPNSIIYPI